MKRCSDSLVIRTQIKTTLKCHFTLRMAIRMAIIQKKKEEPTNIDKEVENWKEPLYIAGGNIK